MKIHKVLFCCFALLPTFSAGAAPDTAALADATRLSDAFSSVAEKVSPSVVSIRVEAKQKRMANPFRFFGFPWQGPGSPPGAENPEGDFDIAKGGGSGVIIRQDGAVLTNHHVVNGATRIEVVLKDGRKLPAKVVGSDEATDLAVLHVDAKALPTAAFADSSRARVGQWVIAIGSPFGLDYTVTAGVLSAIGRGGLGASEIEDYLQTDASINPGNSGGPLVNLQGEVLGINTMIIGKGTGIGFAIPSDLARSVVDQLLSKGTVQRSWIGVGFQELTPELASRFGVKNGALVSSVMEGAPAAKAGISPGDIITEVDGKPVQESRDLLRSVLRKRPGDSVTIKFTRKGQTQARELKTAQRPSDNRGHESGPAGTPAEPSKPDNGFGIELQELTPKLAKQFGLSIDKGVLVVNIERGSPGERSGLARGDVIVEADQRPTATVEQLQVALKAKQVLVRVLRRDNAFYAVLER